ncbi:MAG: hypothetical protein S4CHLAM45_04550 [Chlamydiales bacterium]|nr:hypothetical protein [Chlamydiales bacterium]MCH9619307.1 hypothetical protein [Chlamydiales bacterium]MCH9622569.1 hypothetical protein [Chlamydiales bacterium]
MLEKIIFNYQNSVIIYYTVINAFYIFLLVGAFITIFSRMHKFESSRIEILLKSESVPSIGIIVPNYNEEGNVIFAVQALLNLSYRNKQIIIVNDGSTDASLEILKTTFQLTYVHRAYLEKIPTAKVRGYYHSLTHPELIVIDKENGGRADALNVGINACHSDYFLTIDADTVIDDEYMTYLIRHILVNPQYAGYGACIRVANGCTVGISGIEEVGFPKTYWGGIQAIEYLRAFYMGRMGFEPLGGGLIISGAFSIYPTEFARGIGGFNPHTLGEDMDMCTHIKKEKYLHKENPHTSYVPQPICWTEVPETYRDFSKQRTRWQIALMEVVWKYRTMFFNPRYGWAGMVCFPYLVFGEFFSPILELFSYAIIILAAIFGIFDWHYYILFFLVTWGFTFILNIQCALIEILSFKKYSTFKDIRRMILYGFLENLGFRHLYLWWRLKAFFKIFQSRESWWAGWKKSGFTAMKIEGERGKK